MPKFFHQGRKNIESLSVYFQQMGGKVMNLVLMQPIRDGNELIAISLNTRYWHITIITESYSFINLKNLRHCISIKYCIQKMGYVCIHCVLSILGFMDIPHWVFVCVWFRPWIGGSSTATQTHLYNLLVELLLCWLHTLNLVLVLQAQSGHQHHILHDRFHS